LNRAEKLLEVYGGKDDLKALVGIIRAGASVYHSYEELMPVLSNILIGTPSGAPLALTEAAGKCGGIGRDLACKGNTKSFQDTGFHKDFQDYHNQIFHFWAYVANTYSASFPMALLGASAAGFGNVIHEVGQGILGDDGTSWQDYALAGAGINTGISISMGSVPISELADFVYNLLAPSSPGALGWPGLITSIIPLPGSPPQ
jgi:hypothetical protein